MDDSAIGVNGNAIQITRVCVYTVEMVTGNRQTKMLNIYSLVTSLETCTPHLLLSNEPMIYQQHNAYNHAETGRKHQVMLTLNIRMKKKV